MPLEPVAAKAMLHRWEEPCISGKGGSGAIFFTGCSMRCVYCQNRQITHEGYGVPVTEDRLIAIMQSLEQKGAENINFVNPTHYAHVVESVLRRYRPGVPVVYNSGGYDSVYALQRLEGLVDIYLPDWKYSSDELALRYSRAPHYTKSAAEAIGEMLRQQPANEYGEDGVLRHGVIIRHLVLPGKTENSRGVLEMIDRLFSNRVTLSLMSQYTPVPGVPPELGRRLKPIEYKLVLRRLYQLGFENGYTQEFSSSQEEYIPDFNLEGIC